MVAVADGFIVNQTLPNTEGIKEIWVQTTSLVDATDTIPITLSNFGISPTGLLSVQSFVFTADYSVVTPEANTCAVANGILTVLVVGGTDDDMRVIRIVGRSTGNKYTP